MFKLSSFIF